MNKSKSKIFITTGILVIGGVLFFTFSKYPDQSTPIAEQPLVATHPSANKAANMHTLISANREPTHQKALNYANQAALQTFYSNPYLNDDLISKLKNGQFNLQKHGHLVAYDDPMNNFWSLKEFEQLKQYQANNKKVTEQLGYTPLAHQIDQSFQVQDQLLMGLNDQAEVITRLSKGDQQLIIMQKKWNGTEKMFEEYINYYAGKNDEFAAIYQQYNNKQLQNVTLINDQFSYSLYSLNVSKTELDKIVEQMTY